MVGALQQYCQNPTLTQLNSTQLKAALLNLYIYISGFYWLSSNTVIHPIYIRLSFTVYLYTLVFVFTWLCSRCSAVFDSMVWQIDNILRYLQNWLQIFHFCAENVLFLLFFWLGIVFYFLNALGISWQNLNTFFLFYLTVLLDLSFLRLKNN